VRQIYLSPHLDDGVLSCGGAIHRQVIQGDRVQVLTVFAGALQDGNLSPFAQEQHDYWGNPPQPMALRRAEDVAALTLLGAEVWHLAYLDAVYRTGVEGQWIYTKLEELFGVLSPEDPMEYGDGIDPLEALAGLLPQPDEATVYAPLGVGSHVDHQIVHRVGQRLLARGYRVAFYEDYPYAENAGAWESATQIIEVDGWYLDRIALDAQDLSAKVAALGYYRTQMPVLFGGPAAMPSRVWTFAATRSPGVGLAERIWWPRVA
jgi:LmbE family N-acetylglucosaminyl deacetylase